MARLTRGASRGAMLLLSSSVIVGKQFPTGPREGQGVHRWDAGFGTRSIGLLVGGASMSGKLAVHTFWEGAPPQTR
jgi:hypothetical protein